MEDLILEELTPNINFFMRGNYAYIEGCIEFDENKLNFPDSELTYATSLGKKINEIIPLLLEQDLIKVENKRIIIPYDTFNYLYASDNNGNEITGYNLSEFLPKYSPFFLKIESIRDLGSSDFEYDCHFFWGIKEIFPKRIGCFLKLKNKFYYLEKNMYQLLDKIDTYNSIETKDKNKVFNLKQFAIIKDLIKKINGVETDKYLDNENVVVPQKVKLNITENNNTISIEPLFDDVNKDSFERQYNLAHDVQDVYDTDVDGKRTRVILNDDIKLVTEKLKKDFSNKKFSDIEEQIKNPRNIFRELEGIDQDIIDCDGYSDRVKGIGEYVFKPKCQFKSSGVDFLESINFKELSHEKFNDIIDKFKPTLTATTIDNEDIEIPIDTETFSQIETAVKNNEDIVKIVTTSDKQVTIPISEEIKTFINDNEDIFSEKTDLETKKQKIKKYLIIHDNFEEQTYVEPVKEEEERLLIFQRPCNLKDTLINKLGKEIPLELYNYQKEGVAWLETFYDEQYKKGVLLADDMGLGKTLQVLAFLAWMIEKKEISGEKIKPILIVAPPILLKNWYDEIVRFFKNDGSVFTPITILHGDELKRYKKHNDGPENLVHKASLCVDCANCDYYNGRCCSKNRMPIENNRIVITNYDTVKNYQFSLGKIEWMGVILDEAQYIKEPDTAVTFAIKTMNSEFKIAMTGTPVENKLLDLWSIMDFASPGLLGTRKDFLKTYDIKDKDIEDRKNRLSALKQTLKLTKFKGLNQINVIPHIVRREKTEYLADKLPLKHDGKDAIRIECNIPEEMAEIHQALLQQAYEENPKHHLMIIQQLIKLYQHKILLENNKKEYSIEDYFDGSPKLVATIETLKKIKEKEEKVLIFVTSIEMQKILKRVIDKTFGLNVGIINGSVNNNISLSSSAKSARYRILDEFESKNGFNVLILSPHVAGIGLTILGANHVIHYGRWWNPAKESQATDRAYRIGQDKEVFVYYPIYKSNYFETFDEKLDRLIERKRALAKDFLTPLNDLEVTASEILFDFKNDNYSPTHQITNAFISLDNLSETELKKLVYLLVTKEKKEILFLDERYSYGIDLVIKNENSKELIKIYKDDIIESDIESYILNINKINKNGKNYVYLLKDPARNVINCIKNNNIILYSQKDLNNLIKKHNIYEKDLLSLIIDKKTLF